MKVFVQFTGFVRYILPFLALWSTIDALSQGKWEVGGLWVVITLLTTENALSQLLASLQATEASLQARIDAHDRFADQFKS